MRFMEWLQSAGKVSSPWKHLSLVGEEEVSSVSRTRRFTYFQILCYALERWTRTQNQILFGKISCLGSRVHQNYRTLDTINGEPMEFNGIRVEYFPRFTSLQLCNKVQEFLSKKRAVSQKNAQDGSSSCRCSMTSHGDPKTMNRNANLTPCSFPFMREDFHQEDGHSSDLDQKRSGILLMIADHKENGTKSLNWWW